MRIASLVGLRACSAVPCSRHFGLGPKMGWWGGGDLRSLLSQEDESGGLGPVGGESGVPAVGPVGAYQEQDIVQRSASEQTH